MNKKRSNNIMLCCVPNCNTKSSSKNVYKSCFKFPVNKSLKDEWLRSIPSTKSTNFSSSSGVCILHFEEKFIKRSKDNPLKGSLVNGAVPTIFSKEDGSDAADTDFNVIAEHVVIELNTSGIFTFDTLKSEIESVMQLDDWKVAYSEANVHIYKLVVEPNGNLRVETSINIDCDLVLKIFHLDKAIGMKFSKHTIHRSLKLKGWSHLQKLLNKFNGAHELKIHSEKVRYE